MFDQSAGQGVTPLRICRYLGDPDTACSSCIAMGTAASMPAVRAGAWEPGITHVQRVTRLYRAHLRNSRDWIIDRELWLEDAREIQRHFRANKHKSLAEGQYLVEKGMETLFKQRHPEPYIPIYAKGSSKYQRNVPPPPEVCTDRLFTQYSPLP